MSKGLAKHARIVKMLAFLFHGRAGADGFIVHYILGYPFQSGTANDLALYGGGMLFYVRL